jgi:hypothetical protein
VRDGVVLKQVLVTLFHTDGFILTQATVIPEFDAGSFGVTLFNSKLPGR